MQTLNSGSHNTHVRAKFVCMQKFLLIFFLKKCTEKSIVKTNKSKKKKKRIKITF